VLVPSDQLSPEGAAVLVEAKHMAEGPDAPLHLTSAAHGVFAEPNSTRATVRRLGFTNCCCCTRANGVMRYLSTDHRIIICRALAGALS
jgi:hypothetical protein